MGQYLLIMPPEIHQHQASLLLRTISFLFVESELKFFGAFFFFQLNAFCISEGNVMFQEGPWY